VLKRARKDRRDHARNEKIRAHPNCWRYLQFRRSGRRQTIHYFDIGSGPGDGAAARIGPDSVCDVSSDDTALRVGGSNLMARVGMNIEQDD